MFLEKLSVVQSYEQYSALSIFASETECCPLLPAKHSAVYLYKENEVLFMLRRKKKPMFMVTSETPAAWVTTTESVGASDGIFY